MSWRWRVAHYRSLQSKMSLCIARVLPLLILLLALTVGWAFVCRDMQDKQVGAASPVAPPSSSSDLCQETCLLYGSKRPSATGPPITALNLAETIFRKEQEIGTSLEAAADQLGPPVLPVTGVDVVDEDIALTLQGQYEEHERAGPRNPTDAPGPHLRKTEFQKVAEAVLEQSVAAAQPRPPKMEPLDDLLPARVWTPVYEGCSPKYLEARCNYQQPNPRLFVTNINELMSARSLQLGQVNQIEPTTLRQTHAQLLTTGWRSKKDPYSRASLTNDVAYGTCKAMAEQTPDYVVF